jgi:hypothetical protein
MLLDTNMVVDALRRFLPAATYLETAEQQGTLSLRHPGGLSGQPSYILMDQSRDFTKDLVR